MPDFLAADTRAIISGDLDSVFQTLSRQIVVVKEPAKVYVPSNGTDPNNPFGFGENNQPDPIYNLVPVTGVFPAVIFYGTIASSAVNPEINVRVYSGPLNIKMRQDCRDFIASGVTRHILIDDKTFFLDGEPQRRMMLNGAFYFLALKGTQ